MCLSADDSVLDGFPLCSPLDAPDINHINQISQMKAHNKVNFIAVVVLALCVVTLLFVAVVGWYVFELLTVVYSTEQFSEHFSLNFNQ